MGTDARNTLNQGNGQVFDLPVLLYDRFYSLLSSCAVARSPMQSLYSRKVLLRAAVARFQPDLVRGIFFLACRKSHRACQQNAYHYYKNELSIHTFLPKLILFCPYLRSRIRRSLYTAAIIQLILFCPYLRSRIRRSLYTAAIIQTTNRRASERLDKPRNSSRFDKAGASEGIYDHCESRIHTRVSSRARRVAP